MVRTGALDFIGRPQSELLHELHICFKSARTLRGNGVLIKPPDPVRHLATGATTRPEAEKLRDEWALLGFSSGRHPVACIRPGLEKEDVLRSSAIPGKIGDRIRLCGIAAAARTTRTHTGNMCFLTLSDEDGLFEITMRPTIYERHKQLFAGQGTGFFHVSGKVESKYDAISVNANQIATSDTRRDVAIKPPAHSAIRQCSLFHSKKDFK